MSGFEGLSGDEESEGDAICLEDPNKKQLKKFSHSTRRKRQRVKELLNSEEDLDFLKLPVVDLLWLEEHKQKSSAQDRKSNNKNNSEEEPYLDNEMRYGVGSSKTLFNSHSFMEKERAVRWSKQDTELFYEGVRQFGSNMTMIQQLFPGKTRHQIKRKFKKEENLHPVKLSDAVSGSTKDHTYFRKVIDHLKKESSLPKNDDATDGGKVSTPEDKDAADGVETKISDEDEPLIDDVNGDGGSNVDGDIKGDSDGEAFEYTYCTDF